jgi:ribosomal protein S27AE
MGKLGDDKRKAIADLLGLANMDTSNRLPRVNAMHPDYQSQVMFDVADNLKAILNDIIEPGHPTYKDSSLDYFTNILKAAPRPFIVNGKVDGEWKQQDRSYSPDRYLINTAQTLMDFIYDSKLIEKLRRCEVCGFYFIANHKMRRVCSPPRDCEKIRKKKYQQKYMKKKRDPNHPAFDPDYIR